jgi:hypothetical protein
MTESARLTRPRALLIAFAAVVYLVAAWMVAPGFYDGIAPTQPYNWVCPPPIAGANSGIPAASGQLVIKVINGSSDPNTVFTQDGQMSMSFLPGAFQAAGKAQVTVNITPVSPCPNAPDLHFTTNVYQITADAPLVQAAAGSTTCDPACVAMLYSNLVPAPSFVYVSDSPNGPWTNIGGSENQPLVIRANTNQLGYFAAGYPSNATNKSSSGASQLLPIAVAVLIIGVLVAGIPLAMLRRRSGGAVDEEADDEEEPKPARRT